MIKRKTVLILGAGASKPYGLPVGIELKEMILKLQPEEFDLVPVSPAERRGERGNGARFLSAFRESRFYSIDAFLARRPEFGDVGRMAIASCLLPQESPEKLLRTTPKDDWYSHLVHAMDAPWDQFAQNDLAVITFNYDRSFEVMLQRTLMAQHGKTAAEARAVVEKFPIVHVYGSLGSLDEGSRDFVPYGGGRDPDRRESYLYNAMKGLRVVPEGRQDQPEFQRARALIANAEVLCFLGFGFDTLNVERLGGKDIFRGVRNDGYRISSQSIAATGYGMTDAERRAAAAAISSGQGTNTVNGNMMNLPSLRMLRETLILG